MVCVLLKSILKIIIYDAEVLSLLAKISFTFWLVRHIWCSKEPTVTFLFPFRRQDKGYTWPFATPNMTH